MGIRDPVCPFPHGLRHRVLQGGCSTGHCVNLRAQEPHPVYVQRLPLRILFSHENLTFHVHQRRRGGSGYAVLACAGLGDDTSLAHLFRQQHLTQHVVDLVGSGVVQILTLQINLRASQILRHALRVVKSGGPSRVIVQKLCELPVELRVVLVMAVGLFQLNHCVHQCFRNVLAAVDSKSSF